MEMEIALLAAPGLDLNDWIRLIVVILLIGGSALGGVAKTLINKFGGKASGEDESASKPDGRSATPLRQQPMHPVARPMPQRRGEQGQATARPYPLQPATPMPSDQASPPSLVRRGRAALPSETVAQPVARIPTPSRRMPPPLVQPAEPGARPRPVAVEPRSIPPRQRPPQAAPAPQPKRRAKVRARASTKPKEAETTLGTLADRHLEVSAGLLHPDTEAIKRVQRVAVDPIRRPTRQGLRRAIIMNEILGPPIALRPPDDSF